MVNEPARPNREYLSFKGKTLEQALKQAKRDTTITQTKCNVYLAEPHDEWARVIDMRLNEPDGLVKGGKQS